MAQATHGLGAAGQRVWEHSESEISWMDAPSLKLCRCRLGRVRSNACGPTEAKQVCGFASVREMRTRAYVWLRAGVCVSG